MTHIVISGAGPAGCLMAIYLAKRGYKVDIYERRPDIRQGASGTGRSINLALSHRGRRALEQADVLKPITELSVPIKGRKIHTTLAENPKEFIYGRTEEEVNYSLSRHALNRIVLEEADKFPSVNIFFEETVKAVDLHQKILRTDHREVPFNRLIATDGSNSSVRQSLINQGIAQFHIETLCHAYKELLLPKDKAVSLDPNYLHLWPRGQFMLMGLANKDGSMTMTLFMPSQGDIGLSHLETPSSVTDFFKTYIPDFLALDTSIPTRLVENPASSLTTVTGDTWYYQDSVLMLGDAVHAMVPFFGQGVNCAFEDCRLLDEVIGQKGFPSDVFQTFAKNRKKDTDAIMQMALENYEEMKSHVVDPSFVYKKEIESLLMRRFSETYISRYVLVSYTHEPYDLVQKIGRAQEKLLNKICTQFMSVDVIDWDLVAQWIQDYKNEINAFAQHRKGS